MNLKKILAVILTFGAISELMSVIGDYRSGKLRSWPFGVEIGFSLVLVLSIALWRSGLKNRYHNIIVYDLSNKIKPHNKSFSIFVEVYP